MTRSVFLLFQAFRNYDIEFTFDNQNMLKVYEHMTNDDHVNFPCTMDSKDFEQFVMDTANGLRVYFLKETEEDLTQAKRKLFKLVLLDSLLDFGILVALFLILKRFI